MLLADDHAVVRDGLRALLEAQADIEIVGEAANGREAVRQVHDLNPDVLVMDIAMPELNGIEATQQLHDALPSTQVLILSMHSTTEHIFRALQAGARGYLLKDSAGSEVVDAIRVVHTGRRYLSHKIAAGVIDDYSCAFTAASGHPVHPDPVFHQRQRRYSTGWRKREDAGAGMKLTMTSAGSIVSGFRLPEIIHPRRRLGTRVFDFSRQVAVMAIVNRTPDSFYDKGRTFGLDEAIASANTAIADGADWVDIGGVPFAPGPEVTVTEEMDRVVPVIEALSGHDEIVISVDTFRPEVARRCIGAGAHVINDTSGLRDVAMARVVADSAASLVITHSLSPPRRAYPRPRYVDVVSEVVEFLRNKAEVAGGCGLPVERIIIDPGLDLNKNTCHSLELIRRLDEIAAIGLPLLVAVSNKDFIGETLDREQGHRLEGSLAAAVACIVQGARIVRMHDVAAAVAVVRLTEAILGFRKPAFVRHNAE
ncbi:MAG: dihydropteroate synthase [Burkholderiales bacterium]|nr:dihydropteroate synthase [Burkholderiales bacterium]